MVPLRFSILFVLPLWFAQLSFAQVGRDSDLWEWTPLADHHQAIVEISTENGAGTGVLISVDRDKPIKDGFEGYCLTAWHVVQDDLENAKVKVRFRNGRGAKGCRVVECDESKDIALIWTWVPGDIKPAKLADSPIEHGDTLEFAGLGGGSELKCCIRHFSAKASPPSTIDKIFADVPLLPGDSGGPVFNSGHEVVGIISGGWFWWNSGVKTDNGTFVRTTWPARASNIGPIQTMVAKLNEPVEKTADASETLDR